MRTQMRYSISNTIEPYPLRFLSIFNSDANRYRLANLSSKSHLCIFCLSTHFSFTVPKTPCIIFVSYVYLLVLLKKNMSIHPSGIICHFRQCFLIVFCHKDDLSSLMKVDIKVPTIIVLLYLLMLL